MRVSMLAPHTSSWARVSNNATFHGGTPSTEEATQPVEPQALAIRATAV